MAKPPPPSRAKLLRAGREALLEAGVDILYKGLRIEAIHERAGLSANTFHKNYPSKDANGVEGGKVKFIDDLLATLATDHPRITQGLLASEIVRVFGENQGDPRRAIRDLARWDFEAVRSDPATLMRTFIATFARGHAAAMRSVQAEYDDITATASDAYETTLNSWGATLRKPFTTKSIAVTLAALVEGMTLRWLLDPKAVPDGLFGDVVVAFVGAVIDVEQQHEHIDDVMAPLTQQVMREYKLSQAHELPDDPEEAIIDAARAEFSQRGYYSTLLTNIATTASIDLPALKRLFPNKADIVAAGLTPAFDDIKKRIATDTRLRRAPQEIVERYIARLATQAIENRAMFDALMMLSIHDLTQTPETATSVRAILDFPSLIAPTVKAGQMAGIFTTALAPYEFAAIVTNNVLMRAFSRREHSAKDVATTVAAALLSGLLIKE